MDYMPTEGSGGKIRRVEELESKAELPSDGSKLTCYRRPETDPSHLTRATVFPFSLKIPALWGHSLPVPHPASEDGSFFSAKHKACLLISKY